MGALSFHPSTWRKLTCAALAALRAHAPAAAATAAARASVLVVSSAATLALAGPAAAQTTATAPATGPGAGFVDPAGLPRREALKDIAPVMRPAAVDTLATVRLRGTLRVGVVPVAPMVMRNAAGELEGYSIDLARQLAQDMGVALELVPSSWASVVPDLIDRQFDLVLTGFWLTVQRALVVNFTEPTAAEGVYLVASQTKAGPMRQLSDYDQPGITLAVYADTSQAALAKRLFPRARLLQVTGDHLSPVLQGQAHAALVPTLSPELVLQQAPGKLFLPRAQPLSGSSAAMAVRKGDPDFLNFLNSWLRIQRDAGWLDERARHWARPAPPRP